MQGRHTGALGGLGGAARGLRGWRAPPPGEEAGAAQLRSELQQEPVPVRGHLRPGVSDGAGAAARAGAALSPARSCDPAEEAQVPPGSGDSGRPSFCTGSLHQGHSRVRACVFLAMCVCAHPCACTHTYVCTCRRVRACVYMFVGGCAWGHVCEHMHACTCMRVYTRCMYAGNHGHGRILHTYVHACAVCIRGVCA